MSRDTTSSSGQSSNSNCDPWKNNLYPSKELLTLLGIEISSHGEIECKGGKSSADIKSTNNVYGNEICENNQEEMSPNSANARDNQIDDLSNCKATNNQEFKGNRDSETTTLHSRRKSSESRKSGSTSNTTKSSISNSSSYTSSTSSTTSFSSSTSSSSSSKKIIRRRENLNSKSMDGCNGQTNQNNDYDVSAKKHIASEKRKNERCDRPLPVPLIDGKLGKVIVRLNANKCFYKKSR